VFQNYAIFTHMSAFDNIAFGLRIRKRPADEIDREVRQVAQLLGIEEMLERRTTDLSVNDLQKVAIGRSMITKPGIFLLDEPFSNLDAGFRSYMRAELKKLQRELSQTMIYVTHDQIEAMSMAEKIAIMDRGRLQQYGTPDEVYNQPSNRFVAGFVGSTMMNFLPTTLDRSGGDLVLTIPVVDARPVAVHPRDGDGDSDSFTLGIRPEHIELVDPGSSSASLRGTVTLIESLAAIGITATLSAIALPSIEGQLQRMRRADAYATIMGVQLAQERWRSNAPVYATLAELGLRDTTASGHYRLALADIEPNGYRLAATATGAQQRDARCRALRVVVAGADVAYASGPDDATTNADADNRRCWNR